MRTIESKLILALSGALALGLGGCSVFSGRPSVDDEPMMEKHCQNLVQNGSFEMPDAGTGSGLDSSNYLLVKWTPEYNYVLIQHPGIPVGPGPQIRGNSATAGSEFFPTPAGVQFVFFNWAKADKTDSNPAFDGPTSLSQAIAIDATGAQQDLDRGTYHLAFCQSAMASPGWNTVDCHARVEVALTSSPTTPVYAATFVVPHGRSWQKQAATIPIPDSGKYTLRFLAVDPDATDRAIIDNVVFCKPAQPATRPCH